MLKLQRILLFLTLISLLGLGSCLTSTSSQTPATGSAARGDRDRGFTSLRPNLRTDDKSSAADVPVAGDLGPNGSINCANQRNSFECAMCTCHGETGNQRDEGQVAVMKVIMTRVGMDSYPNTVCGVTKQGLSRYRRTRRKSDLAFTYYAASNFTLRGAEYANCYNEVKEGLAFRGHFASHYHADYVRASWIPDCWGGKEQIQTHIFYEVCDRRNRADPAVQDQSVYALLGDITSIMRLAYED